MINLFNETDEFVKNEKIKTYYFIKMLNSLSKTDDFIKMLNSLSKTDDIIKTHKFSA